MHALVVEAVPARSHGSVAEPLEVLLSGVAGEIVLSGHVENLLLLQTPQNLLHTTPPPTHCMHRRNPRRSILVSILGLFICLPPALLWTRRLWRRPDRGPGPGPHRSDSECPRRKWRARPRERAP